MPIYVYECRVCGKEFEIEQRITADALTDCDCGAKGGLRRVIQPVGIAFKGAGFHINDYSSSSSGGETKAETPATETATPAPTETKTETPAPAPPPTSTP